MRQKNTYIAKGSKEEIEIIYNKFNLWDSKNYPLDLVIYTDDEKFDEFHKECREKNIRLNLAFFEMEYTKDELERARYFKLEFNNYCSEFAEEYDTVYDYSSKCPCCGSGKKQVSDLYMDKVKMGKKDISKMYSLDVVVSQRLHGLLLANNVTGLEFSTVHHKNDKMKNEPTLYQLIVNNTLPEMNKRTVFGKEKYCECCHKSGLFLESLPYYDEKDLENAKDFNYTFEYFGGGLSGRPEIIVSRKVYKIFKDNKIKGGIFDIVNII